MYALDKTRELEKRIIPIGTTNYEINVTRKALAENSENIPLYNYNNASGKFRLDNGNILTTDLKREGLMYVIDEADNIIIGSGGGTISYPHPTLIGGSNPNVKCAGMIHFKDGPIYSISNNSGHYKPNPTSLDVANGIFRQKVPSAGFDKDFSIIPPVK